MWWIILVSIIGGLIVLGILLISIPFDLVFQFEFYGKAKLNLKWAWFFGLLKREFKPGKRTPEKDRAPRKFSLSRTLGGIQSALETIQIKGLFTQFIRLLKRIIRSFKIRDLDIDFNVGLDDPSETFYIYAIAEPINLLLSRVQPYPISINPDFSREIFEGHACGSIRLYPILLVPPILRFVFSRPGFRLIRKMVSDRWNRNR